LAVLLLALVAGGVIAIGVLALPKGEKKADPNLEVLRQMREHVAAGRHAEAIALEAKGNPQYGESQKEIWREATAARRALERNQSEGFAAGGDAFWAEKIAPRLPALESDAPVVARLCEEFCRTFPGHARFDEAGLLHLQMTGEPSPSWQKGKGGSQPGQGGYLSVTDLIRAAEARVIPLIKNGDYAAAFRVYDQYTEACTRAYPAGFDEKFKVESKPARILIEQQARKAFDKLEEKAMTLEDAKRYEECEKLYRDARERMGLPDIRTRCEAELDRLGGRR
jgi:hypothetical protein